VGAARESVIIKAGMKQILEAIVALHSTGIVHRDIKPQNLVLSETQNRIRIIDLGGAADLRVRPNPLHRSILVDTNGKTCATR
jgi:serine/threonine protein kinase